MSRTGSLAALLVLACAPASKEQAPTPPVSRADTSAARPVEPAPPPEEPAQRLAPPEVAYAHGWMPLASTGADEFVGEHPTYDGRGVFGGVEWRWR